MHSESSSPNQKEQKSQSLNKLINYLEHAKHRVLENLRHDLIEHGSQKDIDGQRAAVRLLSSKQRILTREYLSVYAEQEIDRVAALLELKLNNDDGSVFSFLNWTHSKGRIACPACFTEQTDTGLIRYIRICSRCEKGFQHCNNMLWDKVEKKPIAYTGLTQEEAAKYQDQNSYCLIFHCENCQAEDIQVL